VRNIALLSVLMLLASGCLVRSYTVEKPRSDLDISGNRGVLSGEIPQDETEIEAKTRKMTVFEVELGSHRPEKKAVKKEAEAEETEAEEEVSSGASYREDETDLFEEEFVIEEDFPSQPGQEYTVQKNDTLQKISEKFYGTTKKYLKLFEYNKDVMKTPDRLYPGMKLMIPALN